MRGSRLFADFDVRIEAWEPEYGSEIPLDAPEDMPPSEIALDAEVPPQKWEPIVPTAAAAPDRLAFIDGVRRIEARILVRRGDQLCRGAFGSYAVGGVRAAGTGAAIVQVEIGRRVILGSGECLPADVPVMASLVYEPASAAGSDAEGPPRLLQEQMRRAEERLARSVASEPRALVVADGPLTFGEPVRGAAVGYVKRVHRLYLEGESRARDVLLELPAGARTPLFALPSSSRFSRYAWFLRLAPPALAESSLTGIARLEVSAVVGLEAARRLADATALVLPRYVSSRGRDPRSPQNLIPVGALERHLRRRLGDARLIRRHIETLLAEEARLVR